MGMVQINDKHGFESHKNYLDVCLKRKYHNHAIVIVASHDLNRQC